VSTVYGIEVPLGPVEIGLVRFKFGIAAAASVAARGPLTIADGGTASTGHDRTTGRPTIGTERTLTLGAERRIAENITVGASTELAATRMDRLIANPSPRGFVSALIRGFNPRVQFGTDDTNLTVDVQADSDFCFFGVRAHFQRTALESRSTEATGSVEGAMLIGPSALAMRQLALRAGPGLTRVLMRAIPGIAPSATSLASSSFFATWAGPIGWAIPISYGLRDATMAYTDHLRQLGEDRGQANQWAAAFVREAYGHPHDHYIGTNATVARRGIAAARALAERHGWVHVQSRLEKDYHGGRPPRALSAATGRYDHRELEVIAFRFGEAIFRQRRHGGRIPETLERF
jgi:hypothetical protein